MATILRDWSYQYQWLYDGVSWLAALGVGGERRFRQLALEGLEITPETKILDMCCGAGPATQILVERSRHVTGLDASPNAIKRAKERVPQADYVEAFAEKMPFPNNQFDLVHTSTALHEMESEQLRQILQEVYRVLKLGGIFTFVDFHAPTNPLYWLGVSLFLTLFETETAWKLIKTNLPELLAETGFQMIAQKLYAGGSLQVIQVKK
ncbi:class I SAM-dependent methyltransferase [Leptothermofonsia sp. ETS-13]|uniref:class I SAM-dependent methyltransferase n=1 Tax=Leptothermofonsia sp. ETS-13 TaxID=3035696 RepID=UPI003BA11517